MWCILRNSVLSPLLIRSLQSTVYQIVLLFRTLRTIHSHCNIIHLNTSFVCTIGLSACRLFKCLQRTAGWTKKQNRSLKVGMHGVAFGLFTLTPSADKGSDQYIEIYLPLGGKCLFGHRSWVIHQIHRFPPMGKLFPQHLPSGQKVTLRSITWRRQRFQLW